MTRTPLVVLALSLLGNLAAVAATSIDLPGERAYPESLSSGKDGTLYVGNTAGGGIIRIRPNGAPEVWIKPGTYGSASILGVLVDEASHTLWVCSNDLSSNGASIPGGTSALLGFDLGSGVGKKRAPFPGEHNLCNDMAVGADGSVYVTNSDAPQILKLAPHATALSVWFSDASLAPAPNGYGIDGIAFGSDGNLYFNRFDAGDLYRISVRHGTVGALTKLQSSRALALTDAIRPLHGNQFLLIEGAGRLDTMTIAGDKALIATLHDGYVTPTGVTRVGNVAWVSEGQLDFMAEPTKKPRLPFKLFAVALPE